MSFSCKFYVAKRPPELFKIYNGVLSKIIVLIKVSKFLSQLEYSQSKAGPKDPPKKMTDPEFFVTQERIRIMPHLHI